MNNIEVEYKFKLDTSVEEFKSQLAKMGVKEFYRKFEKTVMYDNVDRLMQITDGRIRLRQTGDQFTASYKKPLPKVDGQPKREIEYETSVGDFNLMQNILNTMLFSETSSYEKYRTKIHLDDTILTIDEYPFAVFVEIEGEEIAIKNLALGLGFDTQKHINKPIDTLFNEWRIEKRLEPSMHMKFEGYDQ